MPPAPQPSGVALVSPPFLGCCMPPLGLGILKGALLAAGLPSTIYNLNLDLLPELGRDGEEAVKVYDFFLAPERTLAGEWLFARPNAARDERYLGNLVEAGVGPEGVELLRGLRPRVEGWIDRWARQIVCGGHDIVGFSTTFDRTRASVRLAEAIRALASGTRLIVGGFPATGDMGLALLEAFDVFDLVCHAEGDELIVPIVEALRGRPGTSLDTIRGISYRAGDQVVTRAGGAPLAGLERTPVPDHGDYFAHVEALRATWDPDLDLPVSLPLETARGCCWGARSPCTFCSLNGERITFRSKSPDRVLEEIEELQRRYGAKPFAVVDNILDDASYDTLLPRLARRRPMPAFLWEVRPTLGRERAAALVDAGAVQVQPGIESLSTPALRAMRKGTTGIDNVQALKWLSAYRIPCRWNFLYSLPGERLEWYADVAAAIPRLTHLPPPGGLHRIVLERFSPLFANRSGELARVRPSVSTQLVFDDLRGDLLERMAYVFDYELAGRPPGLDAKILALLGPLVRDWRAAYASRGCTLTCIDGPAESLLIVGPVFRPERLLRVGGLMRRLLRGCESACPESRLLERLATDGRGTEGGEAPLDAGAYRRLLAELCVSGLRPEELPPIEPPDAIRFAEERGWVYRESGRILALPVDQTHLVKTGAFLFDAAMRRWKGSLPSPADGRIRLSK